jgi:succinate dehydrogenase / fumarate reductase, cytochrome b subunit
LRNRRARPVSYAVSSSGEKKTSLIMRTMWHQGLLIFVFVVYHLVTFKYGPHYEVQYGDQTVRDLYRLVVEVFQQPAYVGWYVVCLIVLGFHLSHGVKSSVQSLGYNHPRHEPIVTKISLAFTFLVCGGFLAQPLYMFFMKS